ERYARDAMRLKSVYRGRLAIVLCGAVLLVSTSSGCRAAAAKTENAASGVQINADFGDIARAGQVLMRIDPREYQLRLDSAEAAVAQARARLENSRARYNRARE